MNSNNTIFGLLSTEERANGQVKTPKCGASPLYGTAFYLPIALIVIVFSLGCLGWGIYTIISVTGSAFRWDDVGEIITGLFKIIIGVCGCVSTAIRWANGIHFVIIAYNIFVVSQGVALITKWMEWTLAMTGVTTEGNVKWRPASSDIRFMVLYTLGVIGLIAFSYLWVIGWLKSLKKILQSGGHGWERKNYVTILDEKYAAEEKDGLRQYQEKYQLETAWPEESTVEKSSIEDSTPQFTRQQDEYEPMPKSKGSSIELEDASTRVSMRTLSDWL